jgi:peroxiredoxin
MRQKHAPLVSRLALAVCGAAIALLGGCSATWGHASAPRTTQPPGRAVAPVAAPASRTRSAAREPESSPDGAALAQAPLAKSGPGWMGVELAKRETGEPGVLIRGVMHGSPAERAGLLAGDVVLSVDGNNVGRPIELRDRVAGAGASTRVSVGVLRGDATRLLAVELEGVPSDDEVMRKSYVGSPAPEFGALDSVQGSVTPSLPALQGRVVVLEFWASWCGVCHVMAPTLNGWHDRYSAQGLTVLGVTNDSVEVAGRTAGELGMGYPLASDGSGQMLRAYRAFALPTLFVIDKHGKVRDVLVGYSTPRLREIETLVRKLIAEG